MKRKKTSRALSVYPNQWGLAYAVIDSPDLIVDCGVAYVQPADNNKVLDRFEKLVKRYKPSLILTRNVNQDSSKACRRIQNLVAEIINQSTKRQLSVQKISRGEIQELFLERGAASKHEISQILIKKNPTLSRWEFPVRKRWMAEHHSVGVFDALSMFSVYLK